MKIFLSFFILINYQFICGQNTFFKEIPIPIPSQGSTNNMGQRVICFNNSLYSVHVSLTHVAFQPLKRSIYFVKCNMRGDTQFIKKIASDTQYYILLNSSLDLNANKSGFTFCYSKQTSLSYVSQIHSNKVSIDTLGNFTISSHNAFTNSNKRNNVLWNYFIDDTLFGIVSQYGNSIDTVSSYIIKWKNYLDYDTVIYSNKNEISSFYSNFMRIDSQCLLMVERFKDPNTGNYPTGRTILHFYDNKYKLMSKKHINTYFNDYSIQLLNDTINLLATAYYASGIIIGTENRVKFSIFKYGKTGDSISAWNSRTFYGDTATHVNELLIENGKYYIGTGKFLYKYINDSIIILRDMWNIRPNNYCLINNNVIGFTGSYNQISNIGIMSLDGKIVGLEKDKYSKNQFSIYPNPGTEGKLNIQTPDNIEYAVIIYNNSGQNVFERLGIYPGEINTELNSGLYFVCITVSNYTYTYKWVNN